MKILWINWKQKLRKKLKAKARFGESFDETLYRQTNPRVVEYKTKQEQINKRLTEAMSANDMAELKKSLKIVKL